MMQGQNCIFLVFKGAFSYIFTIGEMHPQAVSNSTKAKLYHDVGNLSIVEGVIKEERASHLINKESLRFVVKGGVFDMY